MGVCLTEVIIKVIDCKLFRLKQVSLSSYKEPMGGGNVKAVRNRLMKEVSGHLMTRLP